MRMENNQSTIVNRQKSMACNGVRAQSGCRERGRDAPPGPGDIAAADARLDVNLEAVRERLGAPILPAEMICHKCKQKCGPVCLIIRTGLLLCFDCQDKVEAERARNAAEK